VFDYFQLIFYTSIQHNGDVSPKSYMEHTKRTEYDQSVLLKHI